MQQGAAGTSAHAGGRTDARGPGWPSPQVMLSQPQGGQLNGSVMATSLLPGTVLRDQGSGSGNPLLNPTQLQGLPPLNLSPSQLAALTNACIQPTGQQKMMDTNSVLLDSHDTVISWDTLDEATLEKMVASGGQGSMDELYLSRGGNTNQSILLSGGSGAALSSGERGSAPLNNSSSLYVKNLPPEADELYLYQKFSPHGALISCKIKIDPVTGKCRGVGFVNFVDAQCAVKAMQQLHGTRTSEGRFLHVSLQPPRAVRAAAAAAAQLAAGNAPVMPMLPRQRELAPTVYTLAQPLAGEPLTLNGAYGYVVGADGTLAPMQLATAAGQAALFAQQTQLQ